MSRPRICFYISDFGYGHAARDIALIRELQEYAEVIVRAGAPAEFMARSLPGVEVLPGQNDPGVVMAGAAVDREKTLAAVERWLASWEAYVSTEKAFLYDRRVDLVLSGIVP